MALCPFATQKLIAPGSNDPKIRARAAVLHVDAGGSASLFDYFFRRSGGIESHFHIKWTGEIEQYRDTAYQADANHLANDFAVSIETQGFGSGKWNKRQLRSIKRLLLWLNEAHGIPLEKIAVWDGSGVGYHVQFGAPGPWTPVAKSCPGPERIKQFDLELVPWMESVTNPPAPRVRKRYSVITANVFKKNAHIARDLGVLAATRAHVIGLNEAWPFGQELASLAGYRPYYGTLPEERVTRTNPILVREDIEVHGEGFLVINDRVGKSPARGATYVKFTLHGEKRAHVNLHANAHIQQGPAEPRRLPRVREFIDSMKALTSLVQGLEAEGYRVTISGDLNWSWTRGKRQWTWAPRVVLAGLGYKAQFQHHTDLERPKGDQRRIEYVFYKPDDLTILEQRFVGPEHSDHPYHQVTFTLNTNGV